MGGRADIHVQRVFFSYVETSRRSIPERCHLYAVFILFYGNQCARFDRTITEKIQSYIYFIYQNQKDLFSLCSVIEISSVS
jgi:hypothetical protein